MTYIKSKTIILECYTAFIFRVQDIHTLSSIHTKWQMQWICIPHSAMWANEWKNRHAINFRMKNRCDIENTWFSFSSLFLVVFLFLFLCVASFLLHLHILHISLVCAPLVLDMWDRCHRILYIPLHIFWFWVVLLCTQPRHTITLRINCV